MQIDNISKIMEQNALQNLSNNDSNLGNTDSSFAMLLEDLLQNTNNQSTANATSSNNIQNNCSSDISSMNNLTLQSNKLAQILELQALQNMASETSTLGSVDDNNNDDSISSNLGGTNNSESDLLDTVIESITQNEDNNSTTNKNTYDSILNNLI